MSLESTLTARTEDERLIITLERNGVPQLRQDCPFQKDGIFFAGKHPVIIAETDFRMLLTKLESYLKRIQGEAYGTNGYSVAINELNLLELFIDSDEQPLILTPRRYQTHEEKSNSWRKTINDYLSIHA